MRRVWIFSLLAPVVLLVTIRSTGASQREQTGQGVDLDLSSGTSVPGGQAYLPMTLSVAEGLKVKEVGCEIKFPKSLLTFVEAKRGLAGVESDAQIRTEVREDSDNSELSILVVGASAKQELVEGVLVNLLFQVSDTAKEGSVIKLENFTMKAMTVDGGEIRPIKGQGGEVEILDDLPVFGCFFYMH